jgi:hypothetical protein
MDGTDDKFDASTGKICVTNAQLSIIGDVSNYVQMIKLEHYAFF